MFRRAAISLSLVLAPAALAQPPSPYAGQETRAITSLTEQDIADIEAGRGWGLAKSAELNAYPGPRHVLDMGADLALTQEQRAAAQAIFTRMQSAAIPAGQRYLAAERALDAAFRAGAITPDSLASLSADAGRTHAELRAVHLAAHIETKALMTPHQVMLYSQLRGYGAAHGGHDAARGHH
jgi:hypothetical protein